jgi:hypothetical protein
MLGPVVATTLRGEVADLLGRLIRVGTTNPPGNETAAAELRAGISRRTASPASCSRACPSGQTSSPGSPAAATPDALFSHTDVVLADPAEWSVLRSPASCATTRSGGAARST